MKKLTAILISLIMMIALSASVTALSRDLPISTKTLNAILDDYRKALKNGETYLSLSDYKLVNDDAHTLYNGLREYFTYNANDIGSFKFGRYNESYISFDIETSGGYITGVWFTYDEKYVDDDGKCDTKALEADKKLVSERYRKALSVAGRGMTDLEKALALYDYLLTITDYPESVGAHGTDSYPNASYKAYGLLRDGFSTCMAYAKLYAILLNESGIPAVTVGSDNIKHEWLMVCIDGDWYHCDPTWDDFTTEYGCTTYFSPNDDRYDHGAVSHEYFLKSDEEFIELEHPDWEVSFTVNPDFMFETPVSGKSGKFDDKFFSYNNEKFLCYSVMSCINGNWYFADIESGSIVRTTMDGEPEYIELPDDEMPLYSFAYGNDLYVSTDHFVYRMSTVNDSFEKIFELPSDNEKEKEENRYKYFSEMSILYDEMTLITAEFSRDIDQDSDGIFKDTKFSTSTYPMSEVQNMEAVTPEEKTVTAQRSDDSFSSTGRRKDPAEPITLPAQPEDNSRAEFIRSSSYVFVLIGAGVLLIVAGGVAAALFIFRKK